ncbi:hypothetical protein [Leuconostoc kimchii]|uniref:hypothetical protein n=1 Tax=Leuconostoc kimchii TaxID=136609 RepID=UPI003C12B834
MLDGRVKTLHPRVHAGLLARRDLPEHMAKLSEFNITPIDMVVVNLYPFKTTIQKPGVSQAEAIENIDIGGPSMLRSAAKNFSAVLPIVDPNDYDVIINKLQAGEVDTTYRQLLAAKVFQHTASYDALIADYLTTSEFPDKLTLHMKSLMICVMAKTLIKRPLLIRLPCPETYSVLHADILHGKQLSYNNIRDADAALRIIAEFKETTVVTVKHMKSCRYRPRADIRGSLG